MSSRALRYQEIPPEVAIRGLGRPARTYAERVTDHAEAFGAG